MGPTRHTNFPGRAGAGRLLARPCFKVPEKAVARLWSSDMEARNLATTIGTTIQSNPSPLQQLGYTTHSPHAIVGCLRKASCRRVSPKTHCRRMHAIAACVQTYSVASSSCASSSITARASRCYTPALVHTPTAVSHLCLSSFHRPQGRRLPLAKHWAPGSASLLLPDVSRGRPADLHPRPCARQ